MTVFAGFSLCHGLRTPREEIAFNARPKIHSHSQIFRYGRSIFCLPYRPNFSDIFDLCLHRVFVVRGNVHSITTWALFCLYVYKEVFQPQPGQKKIWWAFWFVRGLFAIHERFFQGSWGVIIMGSSKFSGVHYLLILAVDDLQTLFFSYLCSWIF